MARCKRKQLTTDQRLAVYNKYKGHCAYCGCEIDYSEMQVDHFAPVHLFGENNDFSNLMPSCRPCNIKKGTLTITKFREEIEESAEKLMQENATFRLAERFGKVAILYAPVKFYYERYKEVTDETNSTIK